MFFPDPPEAAASRSVVARTTVRVRNPGVSTRYRSSRTASSAGKAANRAGVTHSGRRFGLNQTTT